MRVPTALITLAALGCADRAADTAAHHTHAHACEEAPGTICTWAGTGQAGFDGDGNHRLDSFFYYPWDVEFSDYGPPAISDWNNHKVRLVEDDGTLRTVIGTAFVGNGDPEQADLTEAGAPGTDVSLNHPTDVTYYADGTLLLSSWHTHMLRTWDPETERVHVVLGEAPGYEGDGGPSEGVSLNQPSNALVDYRSGDVYLVDMRNERVRVWWADTDTVDTVAGNGEKGFCGDGGPAVEACLNFPKSENPEVGGSVALDEDTDRLYIADTENHRIRVVDLASGTIDTFAGTGEAGFSGDGADAGQAQLSFPRDIEITPDGELLIADEGNDRIRVVDLATGVIETLAGSGDQGYEGDGGDPLDASFYRPFGVGFDGDGNVYVADAFNHVIRVIYR